MKSNKKFFLVLFFCFFLFSISVLNSFALSPPPIISTSDADFGRLNLQDTYNIQSLISAQEAAGSFNSLRPVACYIGYSSNIIILVLIPVSITDYSVTLNNGSFSLSSPTGNFYRMNLSPEGFAFISIWGNVLIDQSRMICYRIASNTPFTLNSNYGYTSATTSNSDLTNLTYTWLNYVDSLSSYESNLQASFNNGYSDGLSAGYDDGYSEGQVVGRQEGYTAGISDGYDQGYSEGEEVGYQSGYRAGFDEGFFNGSASGGATTLSISSIFNSVFGSVHTILGGFDIEIFGINIIGTLLGLLVLSIVVFIVGRLRS